MPIYDFHCKNCDTKTEKFVTNYEIREIDCPNCEEKAIKVPTIFYSRHSSDTKFKGLVTQDYLKKNGTDVTGY